MANESEREQWAGEIGSAWARRQADLDLMMAPVTALLLECAGLVAGSCVLDVGCGAGDTTLAAAREVGPDGHATGQDISARLLALARARAAAAGLSNVTLVEGDAQTDQAPGGPFDVMISRFGVMFFDNPVAAFANIAGQLKTGARLTFVAWAAAAENPWLALPAALATARLGPAPVAGPEAPGPTAFRDSTRVLGLLAGAGLRDAAAETCDVELHHPGGAVALASLGVEVGPAAWLLRLRAGTAADREALSRGMEDAFAAFTSTDGVRVPARVLVYSARVT